MVHQESELGYRGTSHKNCKGVFKGVANACLLEYLSRKEAQEDAKGRGFVLSGEDLANVGPVALLNDLAVMVALGVGHVERNGHHYFAGLSMYPDELQAAVCSAHPDLYQVGDNGFAAPEISAGIVSARTLSAAPFGCGLELSEAVLDLLGERGMPWRRGSSHRTDRPHETGALPEKIAHAEAKGPAGV